MGAGRYLCRDFGEMQVHCLDVASGQNEPGAFALLGADRAKNISRSGPLILGGARARASLGPSARDLVLLPYARFVREPYFYRGRIDAFFVRDLFQADGQVFLKSSMAPSA